MHEPAHQVTALRAIYIGENCREKRTRTRQWLYYNLFYYKLTLKAMALVAAALGVANPDHRPTLTRKKPSVQL
jgi:hypothetical protein